MELLQYTVRKLIAGIPLVLGVGWLLGDRWRKPADEEPPPEPEPAPSVPPTGRRDRTMAVVVSVLAVLMMADLGSVENLRNNTPEGFMHLTGGKYTWYFLLGWTTINFFSFGAEWAFVQRFIAVRSPKDARKSTYLFGVMYLVTPLFWMLPPLDDDTRTTFCTSSPAGGPARPASASSRVAPPNRASQRQTWAPLL